MSTRLELAVLHFTVIIVILKISGGAVGRGSELQPGRSRVPFPIVSMEFFIYVILPAALWPWGRFSL